MLGMEMQRAKRTVMLTVTLKMRQEGLQEQGEKEHTASEGQGVVV